MADPGGDAAPVLRWPSLIHPHPAYTLSQIPLPRPPTATRALGPEELQQGVVADAGVLHSAIAALQGVDLSYL